VFCRLDFFSFQQPSARSFRKFVTFSLLITNELTLTPHTTQVVNKSSNPKWTASFTLKYEFGAPCIFFVDILSVRPPKPKSGSIRASMGRIVGRREMKLLGSAQFDVQDVLGSTNNTKIRRLRNGGVVHAHVEQQSSNTATGHGSFSLSSSSSLENRRLNLRLRADSLIHTHSLKQKMVGKKILFSKPDTYYEISRPPSVAGGTWIVTYRSPTVKESVSPTWDEAVIDLDSFQASSKEDWDVCSVKISIFKVKRRKCKEIGSCETTVAHLMEACKTMAKVTGFEDEGSIQSYNKDGDGDDEEGGSDGNKRTFQLRPTARGGSNSSSEVTGILTVVNANIESSKEVTMRSQRFLSTTDDDENDVEERSICPMNDDDSTSTWPLAHATRPKFSDYVASGMLNIDFCVAIDFTSSNGDPRTPGTQHFSRDGMMNDYEEAIQSIGITIEKYSTTKQYPVWGFGAKYGGQVRHLFQCGNSPTALGTQGILDAYRTVFETDLIMSGPTVIRSVLNKAALRSKGYRDAPPSSKSTMDYCVLLILTDGIVNDLQETQQLVQKYRELHLPLSVIVVGIGRADFTEFHQWNRAPPDTRGKFKFVEFRQHQFDPEELSREALQSVPHETVDYFLARGIMPR